MPAVTRELTISYAGLTVGGSTDRLIDGYTQVEAAHTRSYAQFSFVITGSSEAAFAAEVAAVEAAFRIPRSSLIVTQGAATLLSLSHSSNTGFNSDPRIEKREDLADTGRSRRYTVRIDFERPADNSGTSGRRTSTVNVAYTPARRRHVTVSGVWTAVPSSGTGRGQYEASIAAFATSTLSALGGTYELAEEPVTEHDVDNKLLRFSRVYDEIIYPQAGASDDAAIVRQVLQIARRQTAPGDTSPARRLVEVDVTYEAWIDKTVTQALAAKWAAIEPWVIQQAVAVLGGGAFAVVEKRPNYIFDDNRITATLRLVGAPNGPILELRVTNEMRDLPGLVLVPAWTGERFSKYEYQGPAQRTQTVTAVGKVLGKSQLGTIGGGSAPGDPGNEILKQVVLSNSHGGLRRRPVSLHKSSTPVRMGADGSEMDVSEVSATAVYELYHPVLKPIDTPTQFP